jgi:acyl-CoA synthetase (NDP forming)
MQSMELAPLTLRSALDLLRQAEAERRPLLEHEVYALLAEAGVGVPAHRLVATADDVDAESCDTIAAEQAVVKVVSPEILHKSEVGGVRVCPNTVNEVRRAVAAVLSAARLGAPGARLTGALVTERVRFRGGWGRELLGGFRHDPAFGPVVVLGIGGLDTELLLDALRPERAKLILSAADFDADAVRAALGRTLVGAALLGRIRSAPEPALSEDRVLALVQALGALAVRFAGFAPEAGLGLAELEVNPFVVRDGRLVAIDGLARWHRPAPLPAARRIDRLRHLLAPHSAVVIGASAEAVNPGRVILRNLATGGGIAKQRVWAIHPRAQEIDGCRAFRSARELPEAADLAVVSVPAEHAAQAVLQLVEERRARSVTLIPGGFAETEGGRATEARLRAAIDGAHREPDGGVLVNGGNCLGVISDPGGYSTFFIPPHKLPLRAALARNLAAVSQSGAYLVRLISNLEGVVRPRYAVSFGNQIDVTVSDYLEYLEADAETRVFAVYLEGFQPGDGARFGAAARRITASGRPLLLFKAGRTPAGSAAARSHTAAAVGDYDVCRELVEASGVRVCESLDEFEDLIVAFTLLDGRVARGRRVAVVSNAGFECTVAADALQGLALAALAPETREQLAALVPAGVIDVHNPLDLTPTTNSERFAAAVAAILDDPGVDALVVAGVPATPFLENLEAGPGHDEDVSRASSLPRRLIGLFNAARKPMVFSVDAGERYDAGVRLMRRAGLPCFRRVDRATRALAAVVGAALR